MSSSTVALNESNFEATVKGGIVLIDWWAQWCAPCRAFAPVFEAAAAKHADVTFAKVDTDAAQGLAQAFDIRSIPTLMLFREGVLLFAQPGMLPAAAIDELLEKARTLDMAEVHAEIAARQAAGPQGA